MKIFCFLVISLSVCSLCAEAVARETVTWYKTYHPPYYISDGKHKGIHEQIIEYFVKRLSEYDHKFVMSNYKRALKQIKDGKSAVLAGIFRTPEREKIVLFPEIPLYLSLSVGVAVKKSDQKKFRPFIVNNSADIESLILSKKFKIGISRGRAYSGIIDNMIDKYKDTGIFHTRSSQDITVGQLAMLIENRIDAYFDIPISVNYSAEKLEIKEGSVEVLPVSGMRPYTPVYIGLPHSDFGNKLLRRIYEIIDEDGTIEEFANYYENWLNATEKERYRKIYKEYYSK